MNPRIQEIRAYEVVVPAHAGAINSPEYGNFLSHEWDKLPICLIEARMDDGLTGLGEVGRGVSLADIEPWLRQPDPSSGPTTWPAYCDEVE